MHAPCASLALDGLARGEPAKRRDGILETAEGGGWRTDGGDGAVARAEPEPGAATGQLVHARNRAGRHHEVPRERIGDEGAEVTPPRAQGGNGEGDVELT